jgi:hypothetical protein
MTAVRACVVALAAAAQLTVESPVPEVGVVIVSHEALLASIHCKVVLFVVNENDPVSPAGFAVALERVTVSIPGAWLTVNTAPVPFAGVTVMVAVRVAAVALPAAVYWKVPLPVPVVPCVTVSHISLDVAVQLSDWFVDVTWTVPFEIEAGAFTLPGVRAMVPVTTPAPWLMVDVCAVAKVCLTDPAVVVTIPATGVTEIVEERLALVGFAAAIHWICPEPVPEAPLVIVTQLWSALTVHLKAGSFVVTVILPVPPAPATGAVAGEMVNVPAANVTVTVIAAPPCPGVIVMVAVCAVANGFGSTVYWIAPLPVPLLEVRTTTPWLLLTADHVSDGFEAVTWIVPLEPGASELMLLGETEILGTGAWVMVRVCPVPFSGVIVMTLVLLVFPVFAAAVHWTDPVPVPDAPEVMVIQESVFVAVHWSAESWVVTLIVPKSPVGAAVAVVGLMVSVPPAWVMVRVTAVPLAGVTVMVPVWVAALGLPAALYWKEPFPVPLAPWVIVSQELFDVAVHVSAWFVNVTCMVPFDAEAGALTVLGFKVMEPVMACVIVITWAVPPEGVTVMVPVRVALVVFAVAFHCTDPAPVPEDPAVIVSQSPPAFVAVHWSAESCVDTVTVPVPPAGFAVAVVGLMVSVPPAWVTVSVAPVPLEGVTVIVPVCEAAVGLAAALYWKEPFPVPVAPWVIVSQELLDVAVQVSAWLVEVTCIVPLDAEAGALTLLGLSVMVPVICGAWVIANNWAVPPEGVIEMVVVRLALPVFATADHETEPEPVPEAPEVIVIQASVFVAVHCSAESAVVTVIVPVSPAGFAVAVVGLMVSVPPAWVTVSVAPVPLVGVTVMVAICALAVGFPAALYWKEPFPVPEAPWEIVSHELLDVAVQGNDWFVDITCTVPLDAEAGADTVFGFRVMVPVMICAAWVMVSTWAVPPDGVMEIVPVRLALVVFAEADQWTDPAPVPEVPAVIVIHDWLVVAAHCKAVSAVDTLTEPVSPAGLAVAAVGLMVSVPPAWVTVSVAAVPLAGVTVMVAVCVAAVGLPDALYWKEPFPVPVAPCVTVSHELLDAAVQVNAGFVEVTCIVPLEDEAGALTLLGVTVIVPVMTCWVMVNTWAVPPGDVMEMVPLRLAFVVLAAADQVTDPAPIPAAPAVIVIHDWFDAAVHWSDKSVVDTLTAPVSPAGFAVAVVRLMVSVPPAWVTVSVAAVPLAGVTVIVPVWVAALGLPAALYWKEPLPVPIAPWVMVSHELFDTAVQVSAWLVEVTCMVPLDAEAGALTLLGDRVSVPVITCAAWLILNAWAVPPDGVTEMVEDRLAFVVFDATVHWIWPAPVPWPPLVMVTQFWSALTVHFSAESFVVNVMAPEPPVPATFAEDGEMDSVPPNSVTVIVCAVPPCGVTVMVAVRVVATGFGFTVYWIEPLPVPLLLVRVTTSWLLLAAVHVSEELDAVTWIEPLPPEPSVVMLLGETVTLGGGEPAGWLMVNVCPTAPSGVMVMTAVLAVVTVFAAAVHWTDPGPIPVAPAVIVTQEAGVVAVHWIEGSCVDTVIVPLSPATFALAEDGLMLRSPPDCVTMCVALELEAVNVIVATLDVAVGLPATE